VPSSEQTLIIDWLTAVWVVAISIILFFWLPSKSCSILKEDSYDSQIVGYWSPILLVAIAGVLGLSALHFLNWLTLALLYSSSLVLNSLECYGWRAKKHCQQLYQNWLFSLVDALDRGLSFKNLEKTIWETWQALKQQFVCYLQTLAIHPGIPSVLALTGILSFALFLRWEHPLLELRFTHPDNYRTLLVTRQILAGDAPETNYLPVFSALAVVLSLLGSIDPMQVIRFLGPILGMLMVLSVGYSVRVLSKNGSAALVAMFSLGAYLFTWEQKIPTWLPESLQPWLVTITDSLNASLIRQWTGSELELSTIFVLFALGYYFDASGEQRQRVRFWFNLNCSLAMVAISAPLLLILVFSGAIGQLGGRRLALTAIAITWSLLAILAAMPQTQFSWARSFLLTLPVGLSLLAGLSFLAIAELVRLVLGKWSEAFCLALIGSLSLNFLLPLPPNLTYLEYEMAARKALEINALFPRQNWTIAAPIEQLAETYGFGWYQDLALFTEQYSSRAGQAEFHFPVAGEHLFIFVEKKPFVTFPAEPSVVPDSILSDHTYRHYRSSVGRASLEFEALQMCEAYRRVHSDSKIYYEDEEMRIYQFKLPDDRSSL
jgi:hypothetical protein